MLNIIKVCVKKKVDETVTEFYNKETGELLGVNEIKWNKWLIYAEDDHLVLVSNSKVRTKEYYTFPKVDGNIYLRNTAQKAYAYFRKQEYEDFLKKFNLDRIKPLFKLNANEEIYFVKKEFQYDTTKYLYTDLDLDYLELLLDKNNIKFE